MNCNRIRLSIRPNRWNNGTEEVQSGDAGCNQGVPNGRGVSAASMTVANNTCRSCWTRAPGRTDVCIIAARRTFWRWKRRHDGVASMYPFRPVPPTARPLRPQDSPGGPEIAIRVTASDAGLTDTGYRHSRIAWVNRLSRLPSRSIAMYYRPPELLPLLKYLYFLLLAVVLGVNVFPFI